MLRVFRAFVDNLAATLERRNKGLQDYAKIYDEQQYWRGYEQGVYDANHFCVQHHQVRKYDNA